MKFHDMKHCCCDNVQKVEKSYPNATSKIIMIMNPIMNPHVPVCGFSLILASGMRSSATTNSIAPAEKASSQGCNVMRCDARKNPAIADIGSTTPLPIPKRNALLRLPVT